MEESTFDDATDGRSTGRTCYSSDDLRRFLVQTKQSWARRYPDLGSLADGHNLSLAGGVGGVRPGVNL